MQKGIAHALIVFAISALYLLAINKKLHKQDAKEGPIAAEAVKSISYRNITGPPGLKGHLEADRAGRITFGASFMGSDQVMVSFGGRTVWFWARYYDARRFYFCDAEEIDKVGLTPAFRPLFARSVSGCEHLWKEYPKEGSALARDGDYEVEIEFSGGMPRKQSYRIGREELLTVRFLEHQSLRGLNFPKRIEIKSKGEDPVVIDMGRPTLNPTEIDEISPPPNTKGVRLERIN